MNKKKKPTIAELEAMQGSAQILPDGRVVPVNPIDMRTDAEKERDWDFQQGVIKKLRAENKAQAEELTKVEEQKMRDNIDLAQKIEDAEAGSKRKDDSIMALRDLSNRWANYVEASAEKIRTLKTKLKEAQTRHLREQEKNGHYINEIAALSAVVENLIKAFRGPNHQWGCSVKYNSHTPKCKRITVALSRAKDPGKVLAEVRAKALDMQAEVYEGIVKGVDKYGYRALSTGCVAEAWRKEAVRLRAKAAALRAGEQAEKGGND